MEDGQGILRVCGEIIPDSDKWLYNWLEEPSLCPNDVHAALRNCAGAPLTLKINSPGGEITAGAEIYTALWEYPGALTFDIVGLAASEAGVISAASAKEGNRCRISPLGLMMIHNVRSEARGDYRAMEAERERLLAANATLVTAYVRRTGKTEDEVRTLMDSEKWYSPREALDAGLVDEILWEDGANQKSAPSTAAISALCGSDNRTAGMLHRLSAMLGAGTPPPMQARTPEPTRETEQQKEAFHRAEAIMALEKIRFGGM